MQTSASLLIKSDLASIWSVVTDIEHAKERISCIKEIEILAKPSHGIVGLKWREVREMFGKDAEDKRFYLTEAINSGCIYHSRVELEEQEEGVLVTMSFQAFPQTFFAKLMNPLMFLMRGMIKKAFMKDLEDIKLSLTKS